MSKIFLIGEQSLKDFNISDNLDANYLTPAISTAQEVYLQQIIGTRLLEAIKGMVGDGSIRENDDYKLLLDEYITPYLQFKVAAELAVPLAFKERNAGIYQTNNEYLTNTIMKDVKYLESHYNDRADFYAIRMTNYIKANSNKYPEYSQNCSCDGGVTISKSNDCQIYLG